MATSAAVHLLIAWGFSEEIIGRFVEIEADQFKNLTEDLKILIPNIGPRRKFQNNIKKYLNEDSKQTKDNEINKDNISITENISPIPSTSSTSAEYDSKIIFLTNNAKSETEISAATDNKYVSYSLFKILKIIVSNELSPNISNIIRSERASFLSDHVVQLFPTEDKSVWYIKNKKGELQGRGKILKKYYFTRRKLIKAGLLNVKAADFAHIQTDKNDDDNVMNYEEYMLWLKNNCRPWQIVNEYWSLTSKKRLKDFQIIIISKFAKNAINLYIPSVTTNFFQCFFIILNIVL
ncbi:hypothetical protein ACFW04_013946 [Cataglyphis niger]